MDWRDAQRSRQRRARVARLLVVFGCVLAGLALWFLIDKVLELHRGVITRGTVVAVHARGGRGVLYHPEVQFFDRAGKSHGFIDESTNAPPVGAVVNVLYDPSRPSHASIESTFDNWKAPVFVGLFAAMLLSIGMAGMRSDRSGPW